MNYRDYPPLAIHENDHDVIRELEVHRWVRVTELGEEKPGYFTSQSEAQTWCDTFSHPKKRTIMRYCLVDPNQHKRSYWFETREQCEEYALVYPPDERPDFGKDEYGHA